MPQSNLPGRALELPDLCRNSALLVVIILSQLSSLVFWLISSVSGGIQALGQSSLYCLFLFVFVAAGLCGLRKRLNSMPLFTGLLLAFLLILAVTFVVELSGQKIAAPFDGTTWFNPSKLLYRLLAVGIIAGVVLRLFMLMSRFEESSKSEAESRVLALQARIQPHFLFNSLNTISELAATAPEKAEVATTALASLFRASLENQRKSHSLAQEVVLCRRYLELERFRMDDKLSVNWTLAVDHLEHWMMPKLMLQPLVENAIVHGVQQDGSVDVSISVRETNHHLSVMVENKKGDSIVERPSHGIALDNIRQRLDTMFDDQYRFRVREVNQTYSVVLRIPKVRYRPESMSVS